MLLTCFYAFMTALCASLIMVPLLRRWALDKGTLDTPDERKLHSTPTPRLGGIAIFIAFLFSALIFTPQDLALRGLLAGGLVIFATGIADDLHGLTSKQKFAGQIVGCLVTIVVSDLWLQRFGDPLATGPVVFPPWAGIPFTIFAVVGVTNAINLIDGLDGLAGGVSVMALVAFAVLGLLDGNTLAVILAVALAGAILGFLKYNFYPARIFMGDTGSLTVGFVLGFLAVHLTQRPGGHVNVLAPVLVLGLPVFDALWVMSRRAIRRMSPFSPDRTHVHHKFLDLGFEHRFTVLVIYSLSLFWACGALLLREQPEYHLLLFLGVTATIFYLLLRHLMMHRERYAFLRRDMEGPIRTTQTFNRCADLIDRALSLLPVVLVLYALLALGSVLTNGLRVWPVALLLFVVGVAKRLWLRDHGEFQLLLVYAAACLLAFIVWGRGGEVLLGISPKRVGDTLLLVVVLLVGSKLFFRRAGEFFLGTADFLTLALMVFLAIAAHQPHLIGVSIGGPLLRAILLILAARTVASRGPASRRLLVNGTLVLLAVFALAGLK